MKPVRPWEELSLPPSATLIDARLQLHHALQPLAAFAGRCLTPKPDDSHRSLSWDPAVRALITEAAESGLRFELSFEDLELRARNGAKLSQHKLAGATLAELYSWAGDLALDAGTDPLSPPEYDLPDHEILRGSFSADALACAELGWWMQNADALIRGAVEQRPWPASEVRCWPHHFDLAVLFTVDRDAKGNDRTIGVGLSPGDDMHTLPYLYVAPWPRDHEAHRPEVSIGAWLSDGWLGVTLTSEDFSAAAGDDQAGTAARFVDGALDAVHQNLLAQAVPKD